MGTARNFHVKTGLTVDSGDIVISSGNLEVNSGYVDIDSIKIDGQTISTVTGNEAINITPHGTGSVVISKVDIDAELELLEALGCDCTCKRERA